MFLLFHKSTWYRFSPWARSKNRYTPPVDVNTNNIVPACSPSPEVPDLNEIVRHIAASITAVPAPDATTPGRTYA